MKIMHINSYLVDRFFYNNLYEEQVSKMYDISVYVSIPKGGSKKALKLGDYIIVNEDYYNWEKIAYHLKQYKIIRSIDKTVKIDHYNIIHAHSLFTNGFVAMILARKYKKPYIVAVRNGDVNTFFKKMVFLRKVGQKILFNANAVVFLSESYRKQVIDKYVPISQKSYIREKSFVIPNGIDKFWLNNINIPKRMSEKKGLKALYVGEITKNKNIIKSVEALKLLEIEGYRITFTVIGEIKDKKVFKKIEGYSFVEYKPSMNKENLINEYRNHDIFLMPSITEAFGLVYAEAISQGMPVIYTKKQGFDGQFEDGIVGYAVDCFDAEDIKIKIQKIVERYEEISKNCINRANTFSWSKFFYLYEEIYEKVNHYVDDYGM